MGSEPAGVPPQPLRPARSLDPGGEGTRPPRPASVREGMTEAKPTPVRDGVAPAPIETAPAPEPTQETTSVRADGVEWTVRVRGRGQAGADTGPAPLLVLGFFRDPAAEVPEREALVVARGLAELTPRQLERAFDVSRPPPEPGRHKELFPETATKGRKGDQ